MTEDEAKTKWCPFVRFTNYESDRDSNRDTDVKVATCIGSQCMAWRSDKRPQFTGSLEHTSDGYCGLTK